jgi:LCP family protein required for cell wall assembly
MTAPGGQLARRGRPVLFAVKVASALLSLLLVVYIGYLWRTVRGLDDVHRIDIGALNHGGAPAPSGSNADTSGYDIDGKDENILITGNDDRSGMTDAQVKELKVGRDGGSVNTDAMTIIHVPADGSKATLISLPRDSYVKIPGYGMNRLNAAFAFGYNNSSGNKDAKIGAGADLLVRTVQNLSGLSIDHFVLVSFLGFVSISDAVGGVTVNLCEAVNDTVAHNKAIGGDGGSGLVLPKGKTTIQGVQALEFVRQRHGPAFTLGDIDRTARQRYFLTAAFREVASAGTLLNIGRLSALVGAVRKSLWVDQDLKILDLAKQMSNLSANNIVGSVIPLERFEKVPPLGDVNIVDPAKVKRSVENLISRGNSAYSDAKTVDPTTVSVTVLNGGAANGAAATATATLAHAGFQAQVSTESISQQNTIIRYPAGMEAQAKTVAEYVPGASVSPTSTVNSVTLILGSDGAVAKSAPASPSPPKSSKSPAKKAVDSGCIK